MYVARVIGALVAFVGIYQGGSSAAAYIPTSVSFWDLSWWLGMLPMFLSTFFLKGIDLIMLGIIVIFVGGAVSYYLRKDERLATSIVSINLSVWVRFIIIESAKILQNPETPLSVFSPLVFYTIASVLTTIIIVILTYRRYKHLPFT
jgi:hypothetical protein